MTAPTHTDIVCAQIRAQMEREASFGWTPQCITWAAKMLSDASCLVNHHAESAPEHRDLVTMRTDAIDAAVCAIQLVALIDAQTAQPPAAQAAPPGPPPGAQTAPELET